MATFGQMIGAEQVVQFTAQGGVAQTITRGADGRWCTPALPRKKFRNLRDLRACLKRRGVIR